MSSDRFRKAMILKHNNQLLRYRAYDEAGADLYRELIWKSKSAAEKRMIKRKHAAKRKAWRNK
jgi:hypothetical protein